VLEGAEAVGEASGLLDEQVDGLSSAVGDAVGLEPGHDVLAPHLQGAAESGDFGDRTGGEGGDDLLGDGPAGGRGLGLVHRSELLVGVPGDGGLESGVAGGQAGVELAYLRVGKVLAAAAQQPPDLVQRVVLVAAPAQGVLLDPAAHFVDDLGAEVRSARGAVTAFPSVPFPRAASRTGRAACTAPGSPLAHFDAQSVALSVGQGEGMLPRYRYRVTGTLPGSNSTISPSCGHHPVVE